MSAALHALGVGVSQGSVPVLRDVSVSVHAGQRLAVVGPNGVGKTTLLTVLSGVRPPEEGVVRREPASASLVHVPQEPDTRAGETLHDYWGRVTGVAEAALALDRAAVALGEGTDTVRAEAYDAALQAWLALGGADLPERAAAVADRLGLRLDLDGRAAAALSGGQAARLRLATVLLARADVLLLDEPTNDLDADGLAALEDLVAGTPAAVVLVSHDREFLARTVTSVVEIDEFTRTATTSGGGWQAYLDERALARTRAEQAYATYADTRDTLVERARRQKEWARQGAARVSRTDEPDRHIKHRETQRSQRTGAKGAATEDALGRLAEVEEPREPWELRLHIASAGRGSEVALSLRAAVVSRGEVTLGPLDLTVHAGDRIRLVGPNGSGKTTLLEALLGRLPLDAGTSYRGPGVVVGELEQTRAVLRGPDPVLDVVRGLTGGAVEETRTLLAKFRIGADVVMRAADTLSPGERTRVGLALFAARGVTCLILDEPTNHLDLPAIEQLEQALEAYPGTLVLVTHDRRLAAAVHTTSEVDVRTWTQR